MICSNTDGTHYAWALDPLYANANIIDKFSGEWRLVTTANEEIKFSLTNSITTDKGMEVSQT